MGSHDNKARNFNSIRDDGISLGCLGVQPYHYDGATGTLTAPTGFSCIDAFNCPTSILTGSSTELMVDLDVAGDFGLVRPGLNVGYNAGTAGTVSFLGGFNLPVLGEPTPVPAPAMPLIFGFGAFAIAARRRMLKSAVI